MDERWKQRFDNYERALQNLQAGLALGEWNAFEKQGVIKAFEICYELAWKTLQDLLAQRELLDETGGPRAVLRAAFEAGWLSDQELWSRIHEGRSRAAHVYDAAKSNLLFEEISLAFFPALQTLQRTLARLS